MTNQSIESKLKTAVAHGTPDVFDRILIECEQVQPNVIPISAAHNKKRKRSWPAAVSAIAASLVIFAGAAFGLIQQNAYNAVASVVSFDVNPSIELKVNNSDKILEANALNDDALVILDGMNLKDVDVDVAVNALIGSMVKNGYIDNYKNSILVSVENADAVKGDNLQKRIIDDISKFLGTESIVGAILSQSVLNNDALKKIADEHHISIGKATLIQAIIEKAPLLRFGDLAKLSINELNLLFESKKVELNNMTSIGTASDKAYIGEKKAKQIAFGHAKIPAKSVSNISVSLDVEDGQMVYEVEFYSGGKEYEYEIDAVSGKVVKSEIETDSSDDDDDDEDDDDEDDDDD